MDALKTFVATLKSSASIYMRIAIDRPEVLGVNLRALAEQRHQAVLMLQELEPTVSSVGDITPSLSSILEKWQRPEQVGGLVSSIEHEVLRVGDDFYGSDGREELKRIAESVLETTEESLATLSRSGLFSDAALRLTDSPATRAAGYVGITRYHYGNEANEADGSDRRSPAEETAGYPVWFATNRQPVDPTNWEGGFGTKRSDLVRRGRCVVYVPESHRIGSLGSNALMRVLSRKDDRLKIERVEPLEGNAFWQAADGHLAQLEDARRHAVVFIHGYNVSFQHAALRTAQLGFDLGVSGVMAFFSWPSKGRLRSYFGDGDSIAASAHEITEFLISIATLPKVERVHVIAHSMGNRGALAAVNKIAGEAERLSGRRFGQFILAAADVDTDVFRKEAGPYLELGDRTTLYVSKTDLPLSLSYCLSEYPRVGYHPPMSIIDGFDTVDVGAVSLDRLGHGYVAENRSILSDIHQLIFDDKPASERFGIEERRDNQARRYWAFKA